MIHTSRPTITQYMISDCWQVLLLASGWYPYIYQQHRLWTSSPIHGRWWVLSFAPPVHGPSNLISEARWRCLLTLSHRVHFSCSSAPYHSPQGPLWPDERHSQRNPYQVQARSPPWHRQKEQKSPVRGTRWWIHSWCRCGRSNWQGRTGQGREFSHPAHKAWGFWVCSLDIQKWPFN